MASGNTLSIGKTLPVLITHVEFQTDCCIGYGQFCEPEIVDTISEKVVQAALVSGPITSAQTGDIILALYGEDETWYRARVLSARESSISVIFIDYGNSEVIKFTDSRVSPPELKQYPGLAVKCVLEDINPSGNTWTELDKEKLEEDLISKEFTAEVTDIDSNGYVISLNTDCGQYCYGKKDMSKEVNSLKSMTLKVGESYESYISYVDSANKFWIQLKQFETNLENLMEDIATHVEVEASPLPQAKRGTCCIAKFSEDGVPYRSKVLGITGDQCLVQFVDYGNSESKSLTDLMQIPPRFCQLPIQGFKCCYKISKLKSYTLDEKVQGLTEDENGVTATVVAKGSDEYTIEIDKIESISGTESLESPTNQSFTSLQLESNVDFDACISHVFHPGRFYVQIIENGPILDSLMNKVSQDFKTSPKISRPSIGTPCLAQLSDNVCYRAVVTACQHNSVLVLAVDFGIEEWCDISQLRDISSRNIQTPSQAIECTVDLTKTDEKYWSLKEINVLSAFESKEPLIAKVTGKRGSVLQLDLHDTREPELDRYVNAELLGVGKDPNDAAPPKSISSKQIKENLISIPKPDITVGVKELVCITAVKSPSQFYAQRTKIESVTEIEKLQLQLQTTYESYSPSDGVLKSIGIGDSCCTRYIDGGWYRAIVTGVDGGKIEVTCADFGDSVNCNLSDLKILVGKYASLPQQCIICEVPSLSSGVSKEAIESALVNQVVEVQIKRQKDFPFPLYEAEFTNHPNNGKLLQKLKGPSLPRIPKPAMSNHISNASFAENIDNYQPTVVSLYSSEEVMVTHVIDPEHFHCQLKKFATKLDDLMQQLDEHCKNLGPHDEFIENVHLGLPCLAKFSADNSWYRAKITGILAGKNLVEVLYVDYGNTECQERDGLKVISSKFLSLPSQAISCGMSGVAASQGFWSPEHITQFEDLTLDQNFNTIFKKWNKEEDRYLVEMTTLEGESFNLKFGSMSNSLCLEQPDDNHNSRTVEMGGGTDMTVKVDGRGFGRHSSGGSDGFGAASRSFGGRDGDSGRGGRRGGRDGGFGGGRSGSGFGGSTSSGDNWGDGPTSNGGFGESRSFGGSRGGRRDNFGRDDDGGRGGRSGFGGDRDGRSGGFGRNNDDNASDHGSEGGFGRRGGRGGGRGSVGGDRGGGRSGFGDRGGRSGGFGRDNDDNASDHGSEGGFGRSGGRGGGRGSFGGDRGGGRSGFGDRGGRSGGFGRDNDDNASDQGGEGGFGRRGGGGGRFGGDRGGRGGGFSSDRGGRGGSFSSDRGGRGGGFGSDRGGRGGGFGSDRGGRGGSFSSDRGGRGGSFGSDRGGRGGGFGSDRGGRGGGFGSDRGSHSGFGSDRSGGFGGGFGSGGKGGGFGSDRSGGFGGSSSSMPKASADEDWGDESTTNKAPASRAPGFGLGGGGDSWDSTETKSTSTMIHGGGDTQDKWEHKNLNRFAAQKLVLGKSFEVCIVYSNSPGEFWCQSQDQVQALETLSEKMNEEYNKLSNTEMNIGDLKPKLPCVAKFSEDDLWYRAEIIEVKRDNIDVYFVDYGNTETVASSSIKAVKSEYFSLPIQGIKCTMNDIKPVGNAWSDKSNDDFSELTMEKKIQVKLVNLCNGTYISELVDVDTGTNIAEKLIELGHAERSSSGHQMVSNPYSSILLPKDSSQKAFLSWIDNPHQFWIQLSDKIDDLESLTQKVQDVYSSNTDLTIQSANVGVPVIAQFTDDNSWYRAFIESRNEDEFCVRFVDYGNSDTVKIDKLRQPTTDLLKENCYAYRCKLAGVKPLQSGSWNVDSKDIMESLLSEDPVSCKVILSNKDEYVVEIAVGTTDISDELVNAAVARREEPAELSSVTMTAVGHTTPTSLPTKSLLLGQEVSGYISSFVSPSKMFIQLASEENDLNELSKKIQISYNENSGDSASTPRKGEIYCTKYTEDNDWYRAEVENIGDKVTVCFVDYGNSEDVDCENLKVLKSEFTHLPPFAQKCCLSGLRPVGGKWSDEAITLFEEAVTDKALTVKFLSPSEVAVSNDAGDIAEQLIAKGYADKTGETKPVSCTLESEVMPKEEVSVYISSVEGRSFYVQLASQEDELQALATKLQTISASLPDVDTSSLTIGSHCCAKFSEDGQWYRAVVTKINGQEVSVTFIDYGNGETTATSSLKALSKDILVPAMAFHCYLDGCDNVDSNIVEEKITSLTESIELTADFRKGVNNMCPIILKENGTSVNESLGGVTTKEAAPEKLGLTSNVPKEEVAVFISSVEGSHFYVQLANQMDELQVLADKLQTVCPTLKTLDSSCLQKGDFCCAKFSEDEQWYRAIVNAVSGDNASVTFVDYGNGEDVPLSSLKYLNKDIVAPVMAFPCCLQGCGETPEIETKLTELTESSDLTVVFCGMENNVYIVVLKEGGVNVNEQFAGIAEIKTTETEPEELNGIKEGNYETLDEIGLCDSLTEADYRGDEGRDQMVMDETCVTLDQTGFSDLLETMDVSVVDKCSDLSEEQPGQGGPLQEGIAANDSSMCNNSQDLITLDVTGDFNQSEVLVTSDQTGEIYQQTPDIQTVDGEMEDLIILDEIGSEEPLDSVAVDVNQSTESVKILSDSQDLDLNQQGDGVLPVQSYDTLVLPTTIQEVNCQGQMVDIINALSEETTKKKHLDVNNEVDVMHGLCDQGKYEYTEELVLLDETGESLASDTNFQSDSTKVPENQSGENIVCLKPTELSPDDLDNTEELVVLDQIGDITANDDTVLLNQSNLLELVDDISTGDQKDVRLPSGDLISLNDSVDIKHIENISSINQVEDSASLKELVIHVQTPAIEDAKEFQMLSHADECKHIDTSDIDFTDHSNLNVPLDSGHSDVLLPTENLILLDQTGDTDSMVELAASDQTKEPTLEQTDDATTIDFVITEQIGNPEDLSIDETGDLKHIEDQDSHDIAIFGESRDKGLVDSEQQAVSLQDLTLLDQTGDTDSMKELLPPDVPQVKDLSMDKGEEFDLLVQSSASHPTVEISAGGDFPKRESLDSEISTSVSSNSHLINTECEPIDLLCLSETATLDQKDQKVIGIENNTLDPSCAYSEPKDVNMNDLPGEKSNKCNTILEDPFLPLSHVDQLEDLIILDQTDALDLSSNQSLGNVSLEYEIATDILENTLYETCLTLDRTGFSEMETEEDLHDAQEPVVCSIKDLKSITLKEGQRLQVKMSHIDSPAKFYLHIEDQTTKIDSLLDEMFNFYDTLPGEKYKMDKVEPQMVCAAKFSEDESWYRAKVLSVDGDDCKVFFLDHGNTEETKSTSLKQLVAKFADLPIQAVPCILSGIGSSGGNWSDEDLALFNELTEDKSLLADIVGCGRGRTYIVQLLDMGMSIGQKMIEKANCVVMSTPKINKKVRRVFSDSSDVGTPAKVKMTPLTVEEDSILEDTYFGFHTLSFETEKEYVVKVSHIENPTCFWCQIIDGEANLQKLNESLQQKYNESLDLVDTIDTACVAKCLGDNLYYRGVTRSAVENEYITVLFVDYGSMYCVKKEDVKAIKPEDLEVPMQAVDCMLHDIDLTESFDDWEEEACAAFEEMCDGKNLAMVVKQVCNEGLSVYLYDKELGMDFSHLLALEGYVNLIEADESVLTSQCEESLQISKLDESGMSEDATPKKTRSPKKQMTAEVLGRLLSTDAEYRVTISHVDNPSNFYIIFPCNSIEEIEGKIKENMEVSPDERLSDDEVSVGTMCLARCKDLGDWQRGKIVAIKEDGVLVHLADIGNTELVALSDVRKIPDSIKEYPPQAFVCELEDVKPVDNQTEWSDETTVYFQDVCSPGEEMIIYFCDRNEDKLKVSLFDGSVETQKELDQQVGVQLVKLGFADAVPGSILEEIIEEEENTEPAFNEMSLQRENSYGSTGLDDSSVCPGDTTTDISTYPEESELETTASDSFSYVDFKPVPKLTEGLQNLETRKEDEEDEFFDAEEEKSPVSAESEEEGAGDNVKESKEDEAEAKVNEEKDSVQPTGDNDSSQVKIEDKKEENVEEVLEKFEECSLSKQEPNSEGQKDEGDKSKNIDGDEAKEMIEQFIKHSVEEVAVERFRKEMLETENADSANNNVGTENEVDIESKLEELKIDAGEKQEESSYVQNKDDSEEKSDNGTHENTNGEEKTVEKEESGKGETVEKQESDERDFNEESEQVTNESDKEDVDKNKDKTGDLGDTQPKPEGSHEDESDCVTTVNGHDPSISDETVVEDEGVVTLENDNKLDTIKGDKSDEALSSGTEI